MMKKKKVMIAHYRVGMTDGVSLEIEKRQAILERLGYDSFLVAGPKSKNADYIIEELDFDDCAVAKATDEFFAEDCKDPEDVLEQMNLISSNVYRAVEKIIEKEKPDYIFLHNILSHGRHVAAAKAFTEIIEHYAIPTLGMHHDFYFERPKYTHVKNEKLLAFLNTYVPPHVGLVHHATINTLTKDILKNRCALEAQVITDTFDFNQKRWQKDEYNADFSDMLRERGIGEEDIVMLQATRIVSRKSIEFAISLVKYFNEIIASSISGKMLYNGKKLGPESRLHLLIVGYAEVDGYEYLEELKDYAKDLPYIHFVSDRVHAERSMEAGVKRYSLWDSYLFADVVSYPSTFEGWGNQFIEAVFAHLPIVCYEYPVFKTDIKPYGYSYVSLGDSSERLEEYKYLRGLPEAQLKETAENLKNTLLSEDTKFKIENNFEIGRKYHSYDSLEENLKKVFDILDGKNRP